MGLLDTIKNLFSGKKVDENQAEVAEQAPEAEVQENSSDGASDENQAE